MTIMNVVRAVTAVAALSKLVMSVTVAVVRRCRASGKDASGESMLVSGDVNDTGCAQ